MKQDWPRFTSSPWGFRMTPIETQCAVLQELGMDAICGQFGDTPGLLSPDISDDEIRRILDLVRSHDVRYASFNGDGDFMVAPDELESQIELCCRRIDRAARFEPTTIIVFAGWQDRDDDAVYDQVSGALRRVARHAARYGLTVALENHGGLTHTADQCNRILDGVGEPNIGLNYDPANFLMYGEDPLEALRSMEAPVVFTHFKSLREKADGTKSYCRLRDGVIDYTPILRLLRETYTGWYAVEYEEPDDVVEGTRDDLQSLTRLLA